MWIRFFRIDRWRSMEQRREINADCWQLNFESEHEFAHQTELSDHRWAIVIDENRSEHGMEEYRWLTKIDRRRSERRVEAVLTEKNQRWMRWSSCSIYEMFSNCTLHEQFNGMLTMWIRFTFVKSLIFQQDLIDCQSRWGWEKIKACQTGIIGKKKITDGNKQETLMIDSSWWRKGTKPWNLQWIQVSPLRISFD